jgi:hypothetical protein
METKEAEKAIEVLRKMPRDLRAYALNMKEFRQYIAHQSISIPKLACHNMIFSPDSSLVLLDGIDSMVMYETATGQHVLRLEGKVHDGRWSFDGKFFLMNMYNDILVLDSNTMALKRNIHGSRGHYKLHPRANIIAYFDAEGLAIVDLLTEEIIVKISVEGDNNMQFTSCGNKIIVGDTVYDSSTGKVMLSSARYHRVIKDMMICKYNDHYRLIDLLTLQKINIPFTGSLSTVHFNSIRKHVAVWIDEKCTIWNVIDNKKIKEIPLQANLYTFDWTPDSKFFYVNSEVLTLYDTINYEQSSVHLDIACTKPVFSPDSKYLLGDVPLMIYNVPSCEFYQKLDPTPLDGKQYKYSPDGIYVAAASIVKGQNTGTFLTIMYSPGLYLSKHLHG